MNNFSIFNKLDDNIKNNSVQTLVSVIIVLLITLTVLIVPVGNDFVKLYEIEHQSEFIINENTIKLLTEEINTLKQTNEDLYKQQIELREFVDIKDKEIDELQNELTRISLLCENIQ